ncbi:SAM-dependent methyltransferase [Actinacidiphila acidipaludis]|uniref:Methyltransferase domain-containing protein n=1 Tax=Actinacidiphila acidipaludis TaxID=2873382 RepID=A0ABS7Q9E5_9ACTN|nr:class I SAM-dependent methyltransferase [Streptomyces acidipaludis]MBY8879775.1 methyltransferase domain-containing protein [Streptomyces acidipaludis]
MSSPEVPASAEEYWDTRYGTERMWSGRPNAALVREAAELAPGTVLDLGCGEGGDAIWLAKQGWHVVAVDVSQVALDRGAEHAAEAGVPAGRIEWQRHNLADAFPAGTYDLVSTHFLHSPIEIPRERILRSAADAVAPGGVLLVVGHAARPPWAPVPGAGESGDAGAPGDDGDHAGHRDHAGQGDHGGHGHQGEEGDHAGHAHHDVDFPTADDVRRGLDLPEGDWEILVADAVERDAIDPEGRPARLTDSVLKLRRLPLAA